ncbi:hypothetical protein HPP92_010446 [Vanilla planifolia]|uniref:Uncharacterized protein n=1 Tax=Vanilla planifolia TaxID=51239 RepID=A0A835V144_VANPL|nr:hypothetical protein HPP92_010718 [Vanilla planifolia]KAG0482362.1 hypothetical protein HPP92_010446 [Vanilla planifolia]
MRIQDLLGIVRNSLSIHEHLFHTHKALMTTTEMRSHFYDLHTWYYIINYPYSQRSKPRHNLIRQAFTVTTYNTLRISTSYKSPSYDIVISFLPSLGNNHAYAKTVSFTSPVRYRDRFITNPIDDISMS